MKKLRNKLINPLMKWLLRSPFHSIVSKSYMLISVVGRKSGNIYITPVQYGKDGDSLVVVSSQEYGWWKNLRHGARSAVHLQGHDFTGTAEIATDKTAIAAAFRTIYPKITDEQIARCKPRSVTIRIQLDIPEKIAA